MFQAVCPIITQASMRRTIPVAFITNFSLYLYFFSVIFCASFAAQYIKLAAVFFQFKGNSILKKTVYFNFAAPNQTKKKNKKLPHRRATLKALKMGFGRLPANADNFHLKCVLNFTVFYKTETSFFESADL